MDISFHTVASKQLKRITIIGFSKAFNFLYFYTCVASTSFHYKKKIDGITLKTLQQERSKLVSCHKSTGGGQIWKKGDKNDSKYRGTPQ